MRTKNLADLYELPALEWSSVTSRLARDITQIVINLLTGRGFDQGADRIVQAQVFHRRVVVNLGAQAGVVVRF